MGAVDVSQAVSSVALQVGAVVAVGGAVLLLTVAVKAFAVMRSALGVAPEPESAADEDSLPADFDYLGMGGPSVMSDAQRQYEADADARAAGHSTRATRDDGDYFNRQPMD